MADKQYHSFIHSFRGGRQAVDSVDSLTVLNKAVQEELQELAPYCCTLFFASGTLQGAFSQGQGRASKQPSAPHTDILDRTEGGGGCHKRSRGARGGGGGAAVPCWDPPSTTKSVQ